VITVVSAANRYLAANKIGGQVSSGIKGIYLPACGRKICNQLTGNGA